MKLEMYCDNCQHEWREDYENENCYECPKCHSDRVYRSRYVTCQCGATVYCARKMFKSTNSQTSNAKCLLPKAHTQHAPTALI